MNSDDTETPVPPAPSSKVEVGRSDGLAPSEMALVPAPSTLPVAPKPPSPARRRSRWKGWALLALVIIGAGGGGAYWWHTRQGGLPLGIASGNGRIVADEIDIDTKFAGRIAEMLADEGDMVKAGQVVARMDTRDLEASLRKTEAQVQAAQRSLDEAHANVEQQKAQLTLAQQEFDRTNALVARGFATYELLDQRRQALNGANAALNAANDR
ncbi:MAG TPA: biotin/lipoyl-binding protein, partial [Roseiarcus sp.]|nr:biotin/lipoyl-binding protein [Roseiarcus sp.]